MDDPFLCILGQMFEDYGDGARVLGIGGHTEEFGFYRDNNDYGDLYDYWVDEIQTRRTAAAKS
jgi:hypothetical protein